MSAACWRGCAQQGVQRVVMERLEFVRGIPVGILHGMMLSFDRIIV